MPADRFLWFKSTDLPRVRNKNRSSLPKRLVESLVESGTWSARDSSSNISLRETGGKKPEQSTHSATDKMKHIAEKFWFMTAALCLLAATSTFVVVGNHRISEESSAELVEIVEEVEAVANRSERRVKRKHASAKFLNSLPARPTKLRASCRFYKPASERDHLNGLGCYLLT
jgi:hypothetical protein